MKQEELIQQLVNAQQEIIRLNQRIEALLPKQPDNDVHWHQVSGGLLSDDVLASNDVEKVKALYDWMLQFGTKYIKPYVQLEAYAELMSHMTQRVIRRLAELEAEVDLNITNTITSKTVNLADVQKKQLNKKKPSKKSDQKRTNSDLVEVTHQPPSLD